MPRLSGFDTQLKIGQRCSHQQSVTPRFPIQSSPNSRMIFSSSISQFTNDDALHTISKHAFDILHWFLKVTPDQSADVNSTIKIKGHHNRLSLPSRCCIGTHLHYMAASLRVVRVNVDLFQLYINAFLILIDYARHSKFLYT